MTWRVPPFDHAIALIEAHVRATYAPRGIIIAGSIVRGEAGPTSDFDVFIVHDAAWRVRDQRRFAGVPAELFVSPPAQVRRYFASEHERGRPSTAHMLATGEPIAPVDPLIEQLIREARDWLARPIELAPARLAALRYGPVDALDDARDALPTDPTAAAVIIGDAVHEIIDFAFWRARRFLPRRKAAVAALATIDPAAAALVARWAAAPSPSDALATACELARHVLGADTFFEWTSDPEPVAID